MLHRPWLLSLDVCLHARIVAILVALLVPAVAAGQTTVTVARPNGGERVFTSNPYTIAWTASGSAIQSFDVLFSANSGATYTAVAGCTGLGPAVRSCIWAAPAPVTTTGRIRVMARTSAGNVLDASNGNFTVASGTGAITVTAPNTATTFPIGSTRVVSWTHTLGAQAHVRADLSRDDGSSWETIASDVTSGNSSGSFNWTVSGPATTAARVRVTALNTTTSDTSDVPFTIVAPTVRIAEQPAGTNWGYGTQQRVSWSTNLTSADRLTLKLSTDGGLTFPVTLASQVKASAGSVTVTVPVLGARTSNAALLAEYASDTSVHSTTTQPFAIEAPFISVIRPNLAGDVWRIGASRTISWLDNLGALERVQVELSRDGGTTYPTVVASSTPADGTHAVNVSTAWATTTARVRVAWLRNLNIRDASDQNFAIRTGATNVAPVANAGADQTTSPGTLVRLEGSGSRDADGNTLTYLWTLLSRPAGSAAVLAPATAIAPTFVADVAGEYTARLVVSDGIVNSPADSVTVVAMANALPIADAGPDVLVNQGATVSLDGTASRDPEEGPLTFAWTLVERPDGSAAVLTNAAGPAPSLVADAGGRYVVQLVVSDGTHTSQPDTVSVTANTPPVANAGPDQTPVVGATVSLSGAASADVDGDPLTYAWSIQSRPSGSTAALSDAALVDPTFVVDRAGSYVIRLVVGDGMATSQPATITVNTSNSAPVAVAGADQSARVTDVVTLDASHSTDVDGDALRFTWTLVRPAGSNASLSNPSSLNPTFTLDKAGVYVATLSVSDGVAQSDPDTVTITTLNSAPVANAGDNTSARVQETVLLDGTGSVDVDGDLLSFSWALTTVPEGSAAALDQPEAPRPRFVLDRPGTYVAQLIVHDGTVASDADTITVTTSNSPPLANAGVDQTVFVNTTVVVDGSASFDADFDPLQYTWAITSRPAASKAVLTAVNAPAPSFVVDVAGTYVLQLIVSDTTVESTPDTVVVTTLNSVPVAHAGEDQTVAPGTTVQLSGSDSLDADADPLAYSWALVTVPEGSAAVLSDASVADPSFVADLPGTYVAQLIVNDGRANSSPDTAAITVHNVNQRPTAAAGPDQSVNSGVTVQLNGTESSDPDGDSLTFAWVMTSAPADTTATLSDPASQAPQFVPDQPGEYVLALTVSDGRATSLADTVRITVVLPPEFIGTLAVSPTALRFSAMPGQPAPPSQTFTVTLGDTIEPAAWVASYSAPWLSVSPPTAAGSRDVAVTINAAGLAPGTYQHTVLIEGPRLQGSPAPVTVHLVVDQPLSQPANPEPQTIHVPLGGNIQAAINAAAPGSTILLAPGTYVTNLVFPAKQNPEGRYITITTAGIVLPEGRIDPALKPSLAIIRSPSTIAAVRTNARASYYRLLGLAFEGNLNADGEVISLGHATSQITLEQVPHHLELDRIIITGRTSGQKRAVALNAADVLIQNSDFSNIWRNGQESQAIAGWNTPGRITIRNNRLEAASIPIMFGGSDPAIPNLVAEDILVEDNLCTKDLAWRGDSTKVVKNAFELKAARRVTVRGNIFERVWNQGQDGTAIVIKSVNSSGTCTACASQEILFENNIIRSAGAAFNVSGYHIYYPSGQTRGITIRNNLFYDISTSWGGNGRLMTLGNEPADIVVEGNTIIANGTSIVYFYAGTKMLSDGSKVAGGPVTGFVYTNNLAKHGSYGFFTPAGHSAKDHASWLPGATIAHNVFAGAATTKYYPATNLFPTVAEFTAQFVDPANHDYALVEGSPYWSAGQGGTRLGADHSTLPRR